MASTKQKPNNFWQNTIVVLSLLLFTQIIAPFLKPGLFLGHDTQLHSIYLVKFEEALKSGQFPVRWIDWFIPGFNQPLFNFYQPGIYYFYQIPRSMGFDYVPSLNILAVALWLLSALLMYLFVKSHFGKLGGIVSAYFYFLAPYHIEDIFVRSALPEFSALSFVPGIFWGLKGFFDSRRGVFLSVTAVFTALTVISHPPTFIMFSPLILSYLGYLYYDSRFKIHDLREKIINHKSLFINLLAPIFSLFFGFGLISFFIIPAFFEQSFIQTIYLHSGYYDFHHHFLCILQPFLPFWDYGTSARGCQDGMSFQLGLVHWLAVLLIILALSCKFIFKQFNNSTIQQFNNLPVTNYYLLSVFLGIFAAVFYLLFEISEPIWANMPYIAYIQYSWRFLTVLTFISSFFAGALILFFKKESFKYGAFVVLMLLATFAYGSYLKPAGYETSDQADFGNKILHPSENLKNFDPEPGYMPKWTQILPPKDALISSEVEFDNEAVKINSVRLSATLKEYDFDLAQATRVRFQTHYYPGWKVILNGSEVKPDYSNIYGFMDLELPAGNNKVTLKFEETPLRQFANILSLVFMVIVLSFSLKSLLNSLISRLLKQ